MELDKRTVRIRLITDQLGTVPGNQELYQTYIESKKPKQHEEEDESANVENLETKGYTTFHKDDKGFFIYDYVVKGFLKYAGNVLKEQLKVKNLKSKISDFVFVGPRRIYVGKGEPDGLLERPLRAQTPQGQRVSIARSDYIAEGTELEFTISLLPHAEIGWEKIAQLLEYGQLQGLGQFRNGGYGRFEVVEIK